MLYLRIWLLFVVVVQATVCSTVAAIRESVCGHPL